MTNSRGSVWRKCDFHVHTPFSALENQFGVDFDKFVQSLFKKAIEKNIAVIGITDYFTIDGYKKIRTEYLEDREKLKTLFSDDEIKKIDTILILPNIEFRLNKIVQIIKKKGDEEKVESGRINFHVLFSNEVSIKDIEENFLHLIRFTYESEPNEPDKQKALKLDNLEVLGRRLKEEQAGINGTDAQVGMTHAVVDDSEINTILTKNNDFKEKYLIVIPSDEDLAKIDWKSQDHLTRKLLVSRSHILFSSNPNTILFGLGEKAGSLEEFIREFKSIKPCIWGSDAHDYDRMFEPDKERYCWIKADPTFEGIRQILFESRDRVFIGHHPALRDRITGNRSNYIDSISIRQIPEYDGRKGSWFKDFNLMIGWELTAIIGNKGKGKSAIADIIALLGNSHVDKRDFSFLNNDKFCQRGYAENFIGTIKWFDGTEVSRKLNENVDLSEVEKIKYIPQAYLEKLCNNEDSGFKEEINKVVFLRLDDSDKLGKSSFFELQEFQTLLINEKIEEYKSKLSAINRQIENLEVKNSESFKKSIENKLAAKRQELANHEAQKEKIKVVPNPQTDVSSSVEQKGKAERLTIINSEAQRIEGLISTESQNLATYKIAHTELELIKNEIVSTSEKFEEWKVNRSEHYSKYNLDINDLINLTYDISKVDILLTAERKKIDDSNIILSKESIKTSDNKEKSLVILLSGFILEKEAIEKELEKPFKEWQEYQRVLREWEAKKKEIIGNEELDGSIKYFEKEQDYVNNHVKNEIIAHNQKRSELVKEVFNQKQQIQDVFNKMKVAVSEILKDYSAEQNISIETAFKINKSYYSQVFDYINRYGDFYQNGDEEIRKFTLKYNFDDPDEVVKFVNDLISKDIRYKENRKLDFLNYITSLEYLNPEYDLRLNGKSLGQLSPGEKGGLLLVFYLVLDKDNKPLIIDQPEDNLDNQSVAEILVPYIKSAKQKRQIIMVTHNPNLAIVADAEQIVYMNIDKENNYAVSCEAGGIENLSINNRIVDILEGKMKAFDNRRVKYKK